MFLGLDNGCSYTKTSDRKMFPSKISQVDEFMDLSGGVKLEYRGRKYVIGIGEDNIDTDKTTNEKTKLLTYAALAERIDIAGRFRLVVGTPMSHYTKDREGLIEYLKCPRHESVKINGKEKYIAIDDVIVFPQSAGAYLQHMDALKGKRIGIIDIGGMTIDCSLYDNGKLVPDGYFTLRHGMKVINAEVKNRLNGKYGTNLKEQDMSRIYKEGFRYKGKAEGDAQQIIAEVTNRNIDSIIYEISLNWDLSTIDIALCGGGALDLEEYIMPILPHAVILDDPQFANALGFGRVAQSKWQGE